jgi:RNA polymerase sigma-70 factor (ECF subfamily)
VSIPPFGNHFFPWAPPFLGRRERFLVATPTLRNMNQVAAPAAVRADEPHWRGRDTEAIPAALPELDLEGLYRTHSAAVARWAARLAGPALDAEDLVQEVFMVVQRQLPRFRGEASPATWLFTITERVVWRRRRKERWRRWLDGAGDTAAKELPAPGPTPLEVLQSKQATALFYRALEGVAERYRAVLVLFEIEDLSGQAIADLKGVPIDTIWVWLHRARAQLLKKYVELEGRGQ